MNKLFLLLCFFCGFSQLTAVEENLMNKTEVRGGVFVPASQRFRRIYGDALPSLQLEQTRRFKDQPYLELWGNFEWNFSYDAVCAPSCGTSSLDILNISMGLKAIGSVYRDWLYLYAGIGPDLGITFIKNQTQGFEDFDDSRQTSRNCNIGVGGIGKAGCQVFFTPHFFLDFFADYLYLPMEFSNTKDVGGLKAGIGLSGRY